MLKQLTQENARLRSQLAQLLQHAQQNQQILQRHQALDLELIAAGSFAELIGTLFHRFAQATALDGVTLALVDADYEIRRILADMQIALADWPHLLFVEDEAALAARLGRAPQAVLGTYCAQAHRTLFANPAAPPASVALVPLVRHGKLIGSLNLGSGNASRFTGDMGTDFLDHMASIVAICVENVLNTERLKYLGLTDALTGVNNRRYVERRLQEEIGRCRRHGNALSCLYIDVDHFKRVNDCLGHQAGDEVLRAVAARIKAELRLSDALGRFGGEEFVALLINAKISDAAYVAERIRSGIGQKPVLLSDGQSLKVTVSVGIASLPAATDALPVDAQARELVARADAALYQAKENGRNRVAAA